MRIVFWNIRAGGGARVARIARRLEAWAPDVVALCEYRGTPPSLALAGALAAFGLAHQRTTLDPRRPVANRLLVAARWPLRRLPAPVRPAAPGCWLGVVVNAPRRLTLAATHVPNRVTGHKDAFYAEVLGSLAPLAAGPALLVGDTNSGRPGLDEETAVFGPREAAWIETLERRGWLDAFRHLRPAARAYTWYSPNRGNGFRIDQVFVNRALLPRLRAFRHDWGGRSRTRAPSDHAALVVDLDG
jgi:exodeoxyribonuclease-3